MKKRSKILLSAILTIALCLSLIAGSTFALFTSEDKVNVAIKSGKVKVTATVSDLQLYSATVDSKDANDNPYEVAGTVTDTNYDATYYYEPVSPDFTNGGTAEFNAQSKTLTLDRVTPGDRVKFTVAIGNESNVAIQYRVVVNVVSGLKLYNALTVKIDGVKLNGVNKTGTWTALAPNTTDSDLMPDIPVEIFMPIGLDGEEFMNISTEISIAVEAVQGNAKTTNDVLSTTVETVAEEKTEVNTETKQTVSNTTISDSDNLVTVSIPVGTKLTSTDNADENDELSLAVKVKPQDSGNYALLNSEKESASYDVSVLLVVNGEINEDSVHAVDNENDEAITVKMFVGTGLKGVEFYHVTESGTVQFTKVASLSELAENKFYYNSDEGYITFMTKTFSEYTVLYNKDYAVETVNEETGESVITVYKATEEEGVYETEDGDPVTVVEEDKDLTLTSGNVTVFVPAAAKKDNSVLTLKVTEYTAEQAATLGTFTTAYNFGTSIRKYLNIEVEGLSAENEEKIQIKYTLPELDAGLTYYTYSPSAYQGTSSSAVGGNATKPSYMVRTNGKDITVYTTVLGYYTFEYQIQTGYNPYANLSTTLNGKEVTAQIGSGAYSLTNKVSELEFTFGLTTPTEEELNTIYGSLVTTYGLYQSEVKITGFKYGFKNFASMGYNPTYITFPCELAEGYTKVYLIGASNLTAVEGGYKVNVSGDAEGEFYLIAAYETEATKALKQALSGLEENATVKITSSVENGLIDLNDVADVLSKNGITISGEHEDLADVVKSTGAVIKGNNITFTNITVYSGGLTLEGEGIIVTGAAIEQKFGMGSTLILKGSHGNYTVSDVTLTHAVSGTSAGRAGALEIYGIRQDLSQADAKNNITTIDNVNITAEWDSEAILNNYVSNLKSYGYSEEDIEEMLAELGDVSNAHNAYKTRLGVQTLRTATGIVYRQFGGTLNLSNATIDIPYAFRIGVDSEPRYGWVNVSDSVINTNHFGTERVDYTTFTRTTFKNDWSDGAIMIESGSSYQGDLNYIFKDCTFETAIQFALGTSNVNSGVNNPTIKFENCTFNGTLMTEDNYQELISQYLSFYMPVTNYEAKVGTITFADGVLTVVPTRVAK